MTYIKFEAVHKYCIRGIIIMYEALALEYILSKGVENTVGKGEIARYKQFLLFPQCFQKVCFPGASKGAIVWEWDNCVAKGENSL